LKYQRNTCSSIEKCNSSYQSYFSESLFFMYRIPLAFDIIHFNGVSTITFSGSLSRCSIASWNSGHEYFHRKRILFTSGPCSAQGFLSQNGCCSKQLIQSGESVPLSPPPATFSCSPTPYRMLDMVHLNIVPSNFKAEFN